MQHKHYPPSSHAHGPRDGRTWLRFLRCIVKSNKVLAVLEDQCPAMMSARAVIWIWFSQAREAELVQQVKQVQDTRDVLEEKIALVEQRLGIATADGGQLREALDARVKENAALAVRLDNLRRELERQEDKVNSLSAAKQERDQMIQVRSPLCIAPRACVGGRGHRRFPGG